MTTSKAVLGALGWAALTFSAAAVGSRFPPDEWFRALAKPSWNPPGGIFAPVWTVLYLTMAAAAWRVWSQRGFGGARVPLVLFGVQLVLNASWSWLFFGRHNVAGALADIVVMWAAIVATGAAFWAVDRVAGLLLAPYLAWVSFATVLNWSIWRLNR